jgi:hypothetical protein
MPASVPAGPPNAPTEIAPVIAPAMGPTAEIGLIPGMASKSKSCEKAADGACGSAKACARRPAHVQRVIGDIGPAGRAMGVSELPQVMRVDSSAEQAVKRPFSGIPRRQHQGCVWLWLHYHRTPICSTIAPVIETPARLQR